MYRLHITHHPSVSTTRVQVAEQPQQPTRKMNCQQAHASRGGIVPIDNLPKSSQLHQDERDKPRWTLQKLPEMRLEQAQSKEALNN
ncbi:unnamed protein product, partial [Aphanomyces euteiches]